MFTEKELELILKSIQERQVNIMMKFPSGETSDELIEEFKMLNEISRKINYRGETNE